MATNPTHEQARLHLQLFEERREPRMRQAREWYFKNYTAESLDEVMRIAPPGSEGGQFAMMVLTYWDQACALLDYGLLHEDLFFETAGEFFGVWESAKTVVPQFREKFQNPHFLEHLEKTAKRYETWMEKRAPGHLNTMRQMMKQMRAQMAAKAA
jgi:hypothetical protein